MRKVLSASAIFGFLLIAGNMATAAPLVEDFEAPFPAWESGWLGTNTNLQNYYNVGAGRGNNPDGLWIDDGDGIRNGSEVVSIVFEPSFGASLTSLSLDIAGWQPHRLQVFDSSNALIFDQQVTLTMGAFSDPGVYSSFMINSLNGISRFDFVPTGGGQLEGNTSIDNVVVNQEDPVVPEPASIAVWSLLLLAGVAVVWMRRRRAVPVLN